MSATGKVGPDHARRPAEMRLFETGCDSHDLTQKTVKLGPGYRIFLAVPKNPAPEGGWPILYMLDGNAAFDYLSADHLSQVPGLVIAAIGYDTDRQFARELRTTDFTAPLSPGAGLRPDHVHDGRMAGGAEIFHQRLTTEIRAAAEAGLAIDGARRTLWGHSFGGLFVLYALLAQPESFARFAPISPSIWWDEALIRRIASEARVPGLLPEVLLALGDKEKRSGSDGPAPDGPAPATLSFVTQIAAHPGLQTDLHVLKDHVHIQTLAGSYPLVLPFAAR
ncbi:alpha/beta hydrolase [Falsigemmobacter faecalis]|uniref:Alpha/beta hydrolase n=1 Tax=Falsigemmobacter faecalis TaxID=2488730 RepID=A0A3P3DZ63_9RHOB|nr:alpha/beta hydrolase-fold protein [Falsigemmobacter faecalis]RRH78128.1 alpha/beta hydrolase [Falsigemmobacter faecalis]